MRQFSREARHRKAPRPQIVGDEPPYQPGRAEQKDARWSF
jgi:hypothetical protein